MTHPSNPKQDLENAAKLYSEAIEWISKGRDLAPTQEKLIEAIRLVKSTPLTGTDDPTGALHRLRRFYLSLSTILQFEQSLWIGLAADLYDKGVDPEVMVADLLDRIADLESHSRAFAFRGARMAMEDRVASIRQMYPLFPPAR